MQTGQDFYAEMYVEVQGTSREKTHFKVLHNKEENLLHVEFHYIATIMETM